MPGEYLMIEPLPLYMVKGLTSPRAEVDTWSPIGEANDLTTRNGRASGDISFRRESASISYPLGRKRVTISIADIMLDGLLRTASAIILLTSASSPWVRTESCSTT